MARKRFNADEKAVIAAALAGNGLVEVQNVTQWHRAAIALGARIELDESGWQRINCVISETRGSVRRGDPWPASPGHIRASGGLGA
jgi:hypothetical protein